MRNALLRLLALFPPAWLNRLSGLRYRIPILRPLFERVATGLRGHDFIIQSGLGKGIRFNCGNSNVGYVLGYVEPHIQDALASHVRPGSTAYDVRANVGFMTMVMAQLTGPSGQVVAFEPDPDNAARIRYNAALNNFKHVVVREEAVSDADGEATFYIANHPGHHRLATATSGDAGTRGVRVVRTRSLDSLDGVRPPDFVKMDIEGAEVVALQGAKRLLATARPALLVELHGTNREVAPILRGLNYTPRLLTGTGPIEDAPWDAHILALPTSNGG